MSMIVCVGGRRRGRGGDRVRLLIRFVNRAY